MVPIGSNNNQIIESIKNLKTIKSNRTQSRENVNLITVQLIQIQIPLMLNLKGKESDQNSAPKTISKSIPNILALDRSQSFSYLSSFHFLGVPRKEF